MTDATPQAALLSEASKLSNEFQPTMHIDVLISWGNDAVAELRRLDALVAHLTADRDDTANELALRTKYNMALARERDRLLAKLQATQACHVPDARKMIGTQADHDFDKMRENGATAWAGVDAQALRAGHLTQQVEPVQAGELPDEREAFERWWRQRQLLTFPKDYDQGRLDGWGSAYKPAAMEAWQAALSARKPLMDPQARLEAFEDLVEDLAEWSRSVIEDTAPETLEMHVRKVLKRHGINGLEVKP